ncbi:MAG: nuclear transport factor 2 family protein [Planctomycetota bacterium]|nr:nuclear transport factor 2 family protein [Planctomycetota bacterium]
MTTPPLHTTLPATLAQASNPLIVQDPPALPRGPLLERALLENPWPLLLLLLAGAFASWYILNQRGQLRRANIVALALAVLGAGVFVLARAVETPREAVASRTRALVDAVARADIPAAREILTPDAVMYWWVNPDGLPFDLILDRIESDFSTGGRYRVAEHTVLAVQASLESPAAARVQVKVRVTAADSQFPVISWWRLDYVRDGNAWRVDALQPIAITGIPNASGR